MRGNKELLNQDGIEQEKEKLAKRSELLGFDLSATEVVLPSKGLIYPASSPLHMKEKIDIRSMTAREEDILTSRVLLRKGETISCLIKSCLMDKNIDPEDMIVGDSNCLLVAIRMSGYGPEYAVEITCPECNEKYKYSYDLGDVSIKTLDVNPVSPGQNLFEYKLPMSKKDIKFKLLTRKDIREMDEIRNNQKKQGVASAIDNLITLKLFFHIVEIDGNTNKGDIRVFVENMPARDSLMLRKYIESIEPGTDMTKIISCPMCGMESEAEIPLGIGFFWPDK